MSDILHVTGELDCLPYYIKVAPALSNFLKNKTLATRVFIPKSEIPYFIKRGSKDGPLYVSDLLKYGEPMIKLRKGKHLKDVRNKLNKKQELIWEYFVPRKLIDLHYSPNGEKPNLPLSEIYYDIDIKRVNAEKAREVTELLLECVEKDEDFNKLVKFKTYILWTGKSFHLIIRFKKKQKASFYDKYIGLKEDNFTDKWARQISEKTKTKVVSAHEKIEGEIILDPSQSPSEKLARSPFSLHIKKNGREVDGVCVPVSKEEIKTKKLTNELKKLNPDDVVANLDKYKKLLS